MIGRRLPILAAVVAAVFVPSVGAQIPCHYEVSAIIQAPPCPFTGPPPTIGTGISPNGRYVCGYWYQCDTGYKAFYFDTTTSQFISLPFPAGVYSMTAAGVNDSGLVVGQMNNSAIPQTQGFIWNSQTGQYTTLVPLSAHGWCGVNAINNAGTVCGFRSIGSLNDPVNPYQAFMWTAGAYTDLGVMNGPNSQAFTISDSGVCTGGTGSTAHAYFDDARGFIFNNGRLTILPTVPNGTSSVIRSHNSAGQFVVQGKIQETPLIYRAFIYAAGTWQELMPPTGFDRSYGYSIGANGLVTGSVVAVSSPQTFHAAIWYQQSVAIVRDLIIGGRQETSEVTCRDSFD